MLLGSLKNDIPSHQDSIYHIKISIFLKISLIFAVANKKSNTFVKL